MSRALVAVAAVPAVLDWVAVARGSRRGEYAFKPATLALLIAAALSFHGRAPGQQWGFTVAALALSLAGDIFLMLPGDRFVAGLACFLVAHLCYVGALNPSAPPAALWPIAAGVALAGGIVFLRLRRGMLASGKRRLAGPVLAYVVAISAMLASALATLARPELPRAASVAAASGALLFFASDGLIGWRRFIRSEPWMPAATMVLYHLGQAGLVLALAR